MDSSPHSSQKPSPSFSPRIPPSWAPSSALLMPGPRPRELPALSCCLPPTLTLFSLLQEKNTGQVRGWEPTSRPPGCLPSPRWPRELRDSPASTPGPAHRAFPCPRPRPPQRRKRSRAHQSKSRQFRERQEPRESLGKDRRGDRGPETVPWRKRKVKTETRESEKEKRQTKQKTGKEWTEGLQREADSCPGAGPRLRLKEAADRPCLPAQGPGPCPSVRAEKLPPTYSRGPRMQPSTLCLHPSDPEGTPPKQLSAPGFVTLSSSLRWAGQKGVSSLTSGHFRSSSLVPAPSLPSPPERRGHARRQTGPWKGLPSARWFSPGNQ